MIQAVILLVGAAVLYVIWQFNYLVILRNRAVNAWSQIDVQLKRRSDMIPNLVETVKGYAAHEKDTLEKVIQARSAIQQAQTVAKTAEADNLITGALKSIFALSESYPQLKADKNFQMLQEEVSGTEGKIAYARQFYNDTVMTYNTRREIFPSNLIASMFSFKEKEFFQIPEADKAAPQVKF